MASEVIVSILAALGFLLSAYAVYIEHKIAEKPSYRAFCDIRRSVSCTAAFQSDYGKILGIPNSVMGIITYPILAFLAVSGFSMLLFWLAVLSLPPTIYLAYVSVFKLRNYCVICMGIYAINILLVFASYSFAFS